MSEGFATLVWYFGGVAGRLVNLLQRDPIFDEIILKDSQIYFCQSFLQREC